ncbi:Chitinase 1 [Modicella reniformis]|uniref:chitinase n=1 Tax=Modicella reniformis TaxID=1440133 RepID=A0A9P6INC5_9FUNG|nr:Chitinase 1 [Modicella reniformis]
MIWNLFLGGSSTTRPLDDAVLDGIDLDIEGGSSLGYTAFIAELRSLFATDTRKKYYISAAPQCPFPDAYLGVTLQVAWVDMVFVQFYNNYCGTQSYGTFNFNFEQWDTWAKTTSVNRNVKIYLGVPASRTAANAGYVTPKKLQEIVDALRCKYSSFGGVMLWDTSQAYGNFDGAGVQYSIATARNLKRPKDVVCAGQQSRLVPTRELTPASETPTQVPPAATPAVTISDHENDMTPEHESPPAGAVEPQQGPTKPEPITIPQRQESMCPIEGAPCHPPTSSAELICDGYKFAVCNHGPVKTCHELEQEAVNSRAMSQQIRQVINHTWSAFGAAVNSTLTGYLGLDHGADQEQPDDTRDKPDVHQFKSQHAFVASKSLSDIRSNDDDCLGSFIESADGPFLIDFMQLDARPEFVGFSNRIHSATPFRTQVRIRTNGDAIPRVWKVSFMVPPGQIVETTSRGSLQQRGFLVTVTSDPGKEVEDSMVIRFVIEGTMTWSTNHHPEDDNVFEVLSLPDSSSAIFQTKPLYP